MRSRHRLGLRAAITIEGRPDASEGEQGAVIVEREPDRVLFLGLMKKMIAIAGVLLANP
jgi:hypothetical protein